MKKILSGSLVLLAFIAASCSDSGTRNSGHKGERLLTHTIGNVDSVTVSNLTSGIGDFFLYDSLICFADMKDARVTAYSAATGDSVTSYLGRGHGPTEIVSLDHVCRVQDSPEPMWIVVSREYDIYGFYPARDSLARYGRFIIRRITDTGDSDAYADVHGYAMTGMELIMINDSIVAAAVEPMLGGTQDMDAARHFASARTMGCFNLSTMSVDTLFGHLPDIYSSYPSKYFVDHSIASAGDGRRYFSNFAEDSLIQCIEYPDRLLYEFGYDAAGTDRGYSGKFVFSESEEWSACKNEMLAKSFSTGLYYDAEDGILLRSIRLDGDSRRIVVQAYKDADLIAEKEMPSDFQVLGKHAGKYYGVRRNPVSEEDETLFTFFSFSILPGQ